MFIVIGVVFFVGGPQLSDGTAARMGPGYFPRILGGVMAVLGVIVAGIRPQNQAQWAGN